MHTFLVNPCALEISSPFASRVEIFGFLSLNQYHHEFLGIPSLNGVGQISINSTTLNLSCYNLIDNSQSCMPKIQDITFASIDSNNLWTTFLDLVLPFKWFNNDVEGMF
jgi:hypothetical protein